MTTDRYAAMLERAQAARERAEDATPGPWHLEWDGQGLTLASDDEYVAGWCFALRSYEINDRDAQADCERGDPAFFLHAIIDVPALAADVVALVERVRVLEAAQDTAYRTIRRRVMARYAAPQPAASPATTDVQS